MELDANECFLASSFMATATTNAENTKRKNRYLRWSKREEKLAIQSSAIERTMPPIEMEKLTNCRTLIDRLTAEVSGDGAE